MNATRGQEDDRDLAHLLTTYESFGHGLLEPTRVAPADPEPVPKTCPQLAAHALVDA